MAKELLEPRKYKFKNLSKGIVHVKELRRALSPGKEIEWSGILGPNTPRLKEQGLLSIEEIGPPEGRVRPSAFPFVKSAKVVQKEKALTQQVKDKLVEVRKKDKPSGGTAEPVKASDVGAEASNVEVETPALVPDPPKDSADTDAESSKGKSSKGRGKKG